MRVAISYGCDLEDIPEQVAELLIKLGDKLKDAQFMLEHAVEGTQSTPSLTL